MTVTVNDVTNNDPTGAPFIPEVTNSNVRKWRYVKLAVADWRDPSFTLSNKVEDYFDLTTHLPKALPTAARDLGYITTDGITDTKDVKSDPTDMLQSIEPVRTDVTGMDKSLQVNFGEQNAWTNAIAHALPVSQWATDRNGAWAYADGQITDFPYYTIWTLSRDGVGNQAIYRVEVLLKAKVTGMEGRKRNASDAELNGFTFGAFRDDTVNLSHIRLEDGPGKSSHYAAGQLIQTAV